MPSKGINSTEFKTMVATLFLMVANGTEYVNVPWDIVQWWIGGVVGYTGLRTAEKVVAHRERKATETDAGAA